MQAVGLWDDLRGKLARLPADPSTPRRIAHLDMDAFYASVEWLRYPQLKGLPMVIGGGRRREDDLIVKRAAIFASRPVRY